MARDWQQLGFSMRQICRECGGLMNCANELDRTLRERALSQAEGEYGILKSVLNHAKEENSDLPGRQ